MTEQEQILQANNEIERLKKEIKAHDVKAKVFENNMKVVFEIEKENAIKETVIDILLELDLFLKGTTLRKGYELKKINEKLKEIAEKYGVEVE